MSRVGRDARILLVDDSANDIELALDAFSDGRLGAHIDSARSGREALDYLFERLQEQDGSPHPLPDLILLDLKMPGADGFDVLREIKRTEGLRRIPVAILTSSREEGDRAMAYDLGANSYLVKPVSFDGMLKIVAAIEEYWFTINVGPPHPETDDPAGWLER